MSTEEQLPLAVRELIRERIRSIEALEVVLALREARDRTISYNELAGALRISAAAVASAVEELVLTDLVTSEGPGARYAAGSDELNRSVAALVDAYAHFRVETLVFISSNAIGRVRKSALHTFAEAFKLQGRKKMTAQVVYLLCALTSLSCAGLLIRSYLGDRTRLSLWSSLCFGGLAINNSLLFLDSVMSLPAELVLFRTALAVVAMSLLIYGLVWEVH